MKNILNLLILLTLGALMSGVALAAPPVGSVPDAGTTSSLLAIALGGLTLLRRFVR